MPKTMQKTIYQLVGEYANTVGRFGPDSEQVREFRTVHADNRELIEYANALDRIKRHFSGRGKSSATSKMRKPVGR